MGHRIYEIRTHHIVRDAEDRNHFCCLLRSTNCHVSASGDDIHPSLDEFRRIFRNQINVRAQAR